MERQGVPLTDEERTAIQHCQSEMTKVAAYSFLLTTPAASLLAHTIQRRGQQSKLLTLGVGVLSGFSVAGYMAINQSPKCYQRIMALPTDSKLRGAVYGQMLEYNPALADRVIHQLHEKKQNEQGQDPVASTPPTVTGR